MPFIHFYQKMVDHSNFCSTKVTVFSRKITINDIIKVYCWLITDQSTLLRLNCCCEMFYCTGQIHPCIFTWTRLSKFVTTLGNYENLTSFQLSKIPHLANHPRNVFLMFVTFRPLNLTTYKINTSVLNIVISGWKKKRI